MGTASGVRVVVCFLALTGCSGAELVLRSPVESQCKSAGLRGCDDLADGVVLYADGQKPLGYDKIKQGLAVNMDDPEKIKALAGAMKLLQKAPGVGQYVSMLRPLIDMMDAAADEGVKKKNAKVAAKAAVADDDDPDEEKPKTAKKGSAKDDDDAPAKPVEGRAAKVRSPPEEGALRTATVLVVGHPKAKACLALGNTAAGLKGDAQCVVAFTGPLLITDVHVGAGCPNEMVVLAGDAQAPRWFVVAPSSLGASVHGGAFTLGPFEDLIISARLGSAKGLRTDASCAVTWAGRKLPLGT